MDQARKRIADEEKNIQRCLEKGDVYGAYVSGIVVQELTAALAHAVERLTDTPQSTGKS